MAKNWHVKRLQNPRPLRPDLRYIATIKGLVNKANRACAVCQKREYIYGERRKDRKKLSRDYRMRPQLEKMLTRRKLLEMSCPMVPYVVQCATYF